MEFKNLADVTKLEEVPEGASVLAATADGNVVRVPGDGLGGGGNGGGGIFTVTFTCHDYDNYTYTADKTYAEIESACKSGAFVRGVEYLNSDGEYGCFEYSLSSLYSDDGYGSVEFNSTSWSNDGDAWITVLTVNSNGNVYARIMEGSLS